MTKPNPRIGASLDELLEEDGTLAEANALALKRTLAWQVTKTMQEQRITKTEMARRMKTSRASLDRLLDPENASITLSTMDKAAVVLGKRLCLDLVDAGVRRDSSFAARPPAGPTDSVGGRQGVRRPA